MARKLRNTTEGRKTIRGEKNANNKGPEKKRVNQQSLTIKNSKKPKLLTGKSNKVSMNYQISFCDVVIRTSFNHFC